MFILQENNLERAADWIFSHAAELDSMEMDVTQVETGPQCPDGDGSEFMTVKWVLLSSYINVTITNRIYRNSR